LIIGYLLSPSAVAFYAIPYTLSEKLWLLVGNVTSVVYPTASALHAQGQPSTLRELYTRSTRIVAASTALPALLLCLFAHELLLHWIGPEFARHGAQPLRLLSIAFFVNSLAHLPFVVSQSLGVPQIAARFSGLNALLTLAFLSLLVPHFGIVGGAAGFLTAQLALTPWFIHTANRLLGITWPQLAVRSLGPVLAIAAAVGVPSTLLRPMVSSLPSLLSLFGLDLAVYVVLLFVFALDRVERDLCRQGAARAIGAVKALTVAHV
jgi:O-antigen/teichoic acid export membrane protein